MWEKSVGLWSKSSLELASCSLILAVNNEREADVPDHCLDSPIRFQQ